VAACDGYGIHRRRSENVIQISVRCPVVDARKRALEATEARASETSQARLFAKYFFVDLQNECCVKHKLSLGESFNNVAMLADDCSSGCDNRAAIRLISDADDVLRNNHRTSRTRNECLLRIFGVHDALRWMGLIKKIFVSLTAL
jgi:hypothetical protein